MATETQASAAERMELWHELMEFYIREAWLLDERRFREWLDLFTEDVFYFMPRRLNVHRHETDRELTPGGRPGDLRGRQNVPADARGPSGNGHGLGRRSAVAHAAPGGQPGDVDLQPDGEVHAKTAFILYRSHHETEENVFAGYREDVLRPVDGELEDSPPHHRPGLQRHPRQEPERVFLGRSSKRCVPSLSARGAPRCGDLVEQAVAQRATRLPRSARDDSFVAADPRPGAYPP